MPSAITHTRVAYPRLVHTKPLSLQLCSDCIRVHRLHRFSGVGLRSSLKGVGRCNKHNLFWSVTLTRTEALLRHALAGQGEATPTIPTLATPLGSLPLRFLRFPPSSISCLSSPPFLFPFFGLAPEVKNTKPETAPNGASRAAISSVRLTYLSILPRR